MANPNRLGHTLGGMIRLIMEVPALENTFLSDWRFALRNNCTVPSGRVKRLDEFLDLPHLDILLRNVGTHLGRPRKLLLGT